MRTLRPAALVLALALASCARVGLPNARSPRTDEVRALWVRATLTSPERIRAMVEQAERSGFNTLIVLVRGRGDAFWTSDVEPRSETLDGQAADFDPLALVVHEAHARGLRVHAWVNTFLVWDTGGLPADANHMVRARPDLLAVPRSLAPTLFAMPPEDPRYVEALLAHAAQNTQTVEGLYASPSAPEVHERILRIWMELAQRYPVDGLHFDYIRYPNGEYDYSPGALRSFRAWVRPRLSAERGAELDRAAARDPVAWTQELPGEWDEFRRASVTGLVRRVSQEVRRVRPGLRVSAAVFADAADAREHRFQSWPEWMEERLLDVVAPMAYTTDDERFRAQIDFAVRVAGRQRVWAGIGAWQDSFEGTLAKIGVARELGAAGFSLFSYDWAAAQRGDGTELPYLEALKRRAFER